MERSYNIIVVDDHPLFREGIRLLIEKEGIGKVVGVAEDGQMFLQLLEKQVPDLVLMDIEMPVMNGLEATRRAKEQYPDLKILVLTMMEGHEKCAEMITAGAVGFVHKTAEKPVLEKAIQTVMAGENYYSLDMLRSIVLSLGKKEQEQARAKSVKEEINFSEREYEVLKYLCEGLTVAEIAEKIFRSVKTVEACRSKLLEKTNTRNSINLVLFSIKNKLVDI